MEKQCLVSWASTGWSGKQDEEVGTPINDDWLISPRIIGGTQLSFWAKQPDAESVRGKNEAFEIQTSSTTNDVQSFKLLKAEVMSVKESWVQYAYTLPQNAKYFAIRHTTGAFMLLLDDITYVAYKDLTLIGYNVYRDGSKITESPVDKVTFKDISPEVGTHHYAVSTVYDLGESALSNAVEITRTSGINNIQTDCHVYGKDKTITVKDAEGCHLSIYTLAGNMIADTAIDQKFSISVPQGIYLVKINNCVIKVAVE